MKITRAIVGGIVIVFLAGVAIWQFNRISPLPVSNQPADNLNTSVVGQAEVTYCQPGESADNCSGSQLSNKAITQVGSVAVAATPLAAPLEPTALPSPLPTAASIFANLPRIPVAAGQSPLVPPPLLSEQIQMAPWWQRVTDIFSTIF